MEKLLSVQEYAKKYGYSRQAIYDFIGNGKIPKENVQIESKEVIRLIDEEPKKNNK